MCSEHWHTSEGRSECHEPPQELAKRSPPSFTGLLGRGSELLCRFRTRVEISDDEKFQDPPQTKVLSALVV